MGRFANKHPKELTELVATAVANGMTAAETQRQLAAGSLPGWPEAYEMPLETVRYYGKKERAKRAAGTVTPEAQANPKREVDRLARLLLSAAQTGLQAARPQIDKNPKALKEWGEALKVINSLVSDTSEPDGKKGKTKQPVPPDPLTARLTSPPADRQDQTEKGKTTPTSPTVPHTAPTPDSGGVAAEAPGGGGEGPVWGPRMAANGTVTGTS